MTIYRSINQCWFAMLLGVTSPGSPNKNSTAASCLLRHQQLRPKCHPEKSKWALTSRRWRVPTGGLLKNFTNKFEGEESRTSQKGNKRYEERQCWHPSFNFQLSRLFSLFVSLSFFSTKEKLWLWLDQLAITTMHCGWEDPTCNEAQKGTGQQSQESATGWEAWTSSGSTRHGGR